jgi:hypothetical protein
MNALSIEIRDSQGPQIEGQSRAISNSLSPEALNKFLGFFLRHFIFEINFNFASTNAL